MIGPYTREKICNLNDHCNDDCNSSLECEFSRGTSLCAQVQRSRKLSRPKDDYFECFCVHTQNSHCNLSETSLEVTSGLEFEFVIVISIRDSNLRTHVLKIRH